MREVDKISRQKICEILDRFPDLPSRTLARVAFKESPKLFLSIERARSLIRMLRGAKGKENLDKLKFRKYVKSI